jgi:8-oxo-dGTP diphosphatase
MSKEKRQNIQLAVDIVVFALREKELSTLLIRRGHEPFAGCWALPGGFVEDRESLETAARRECVEETGVRDLYLDQLYTFGDPQRDPRARIVSVAYMAILPAEKEATAGSDAAEAAWFSMPALPRLAFDHAVILEKARDRLSLLVATTPLLFKLLPQEFTLTEAQNLCEVVTGQKLDKRNFRKKILQLGVLDGLRKLRREGVSRPAQLFSFSARRFRERYEKGGFNLR